MKVNKILKETTNRRVYNLTVNGTAGSCPICGPNRGCNRNRDNDRNWKLYRKTQWREE